MLTLPPLLATGRNLAHRLQPGPRVPLLQPVHVHAQAGGAGLDASMALVHHDGLGHGRSLAFQEGAHIVVQAPLVALEGQNVISRLLNHLLGYLPLAVHGIGRDHHSLQGQHFQELGKGGDLVALSVNGPLAQHQPLLGSPGVDQVQWRTPFRLVVGTAQCLAVQGQHPLAALGEVSHEAQKPAMELLRVQQAEHP